MLEIMSFMTYTLSPMDVNLPAVMDEERGDHRSSKRSQGKAREIAPRNQIRREGYRFTRVSCLQISSGPCRSFHNALKSDQERGKNAKDNSHGKCGSTAGRGKFGYGSD
jgi:hypothetical protein